MRDERAGKDRTALGYRIKEGFKAKRVAAIEEITSGLADTLIK